MSQANPTATASTGELTEEERVNIQKRLDKRDKTIRKLAKQIRVGNENAARATDPKERKKWLDTVVSGENNIDTIIKQDKALRKKLAGEPEEREEAGPSRRPLTGAEARLRNHELRVKVIEYSRRKSVEAATRAAEEAKDVSAELEEGEEEVGKKTYGTFELPERHA
jgi:hypothetical protein